MTATSSDRALLPWSHRLGGAGRVIVTLCSGAFAALVGTFAHRMGASANIPYGLALAFLLVGISTWCARSRCGVAGVGWHLISCSGVAWLIAMGVGGNGDALTPIGFGSDVPYFSDHAGYLWLYGLILLQGALLLMPSRWFTMTPRTPAPPAVGADTIDTDDADADDIDTSAAAMAVADAPAADAPAGADGAVADATAVDAPAAVSAADTAAAGPMPASTDGDAQEGH